MLQLFAPGERFCDEFGGGAAHDPNMLQLFAPAGNFCNKFGG